MSTNSSSPSPSLSRREALFNVLKGTVVSTVVAPIVVQAEPITPALALDPEFVPENDYPFFGFEPQTEV
jgi:hypothetical protein